MPLWTAAAAAAETGEEADCSIALALLGACMVYRPDGQAELRSLPPTANNEKRIAFLCEVIGAQELQSPNCSRLPAELMLVCNEEDGITRPERRNTRAELELEWTEEQGALWGTVVVMRRDHVCFF
jgi:hypothetical protein